MTQSFTSPLRRYFELELPRGHARRKRWPLLIALHGYEGDKDSMMRLARRIAGGRMIVIALQGPYQFWLHGEDHRNVRVGFGWGTSYKARDNVDLHHRDIKALMALAARKYRADPRRVFLLGFSQACAYNYRFAFTYPRRVRGVIAVCGGVPGDWYENPRYRNARPAPSSASALALQAPDGVRVLHIAATEDRWYSREKNELFRRQLAERAASLDFRFYRSPHRFPRAAIPHIRRWMEKAST